MAKNNPPYDTEWTMYPVCPYCGYKNTAVFDDPLTQGEEECLSCEKTFMCEYDVEVTFSTKKLWEDEVEEDQP